jgi:hypothetical protein
VISLMRAPWRLPSARDSLKSATVLLASTGKPFSAAAIARAAELAGGGRIRVVTVAKIHGSSFGLQHPGLMPNKKERDQAQAIVTTAIKALQRAGARADGEVVITRSPGRSFARAARAARDVKHVVIDDARAGRPGRFAAWAAARSVRYRLKDVDVTAVSGGIVHDADRGHRQEARGELDQLDRAV